MSLSLSNHLEDRRWLQRSDDPTMSPLDAWEYAEQIYGHGLDGDEVRYHEYTGTVLVRKDSTLVTVIDVGDCNWSVRQAVRHCRGGEPR